MQIRKVKALVDTYGKDLTGDTVDMMAGTIHIIKSSEIEWFEDRPDKFELFPNAELLTYAFDINGVPNGFYLPDGTVKYFADFGSAGGGEELVQIQADIAAIEGVNATQQTAIGVAQGQITALQNDVTAIVGVNATQGTAIGTLQTGLTAVQNTNTTQQTAIDSLQTASTNAQNAITAIQTTNTAQQGEIDALQLAMTDAENSITAIQSALSNSVLRVNSITSDSKTEGVPLDHLITLNRASLQGDVLPWAIEPMTATISDYIAPPTVPNTITLYGNFMLFSAGVSSFTMTVPTVQDASLENNESYIIGCGGLYATGTIVNDDALVSVHVASVSSPSVAEGQVLTFGVVLTGTTTQQETYAFTLSGNATASVDYVSSPTFTPNTITLANNAITIPVGVGSFDVAFNTIDGSVIEGTETLVVTIEGVAGVGTIVDNDTVGMSALTRVNVFESPYGLLGTTQKGQVSSNGGFFTVVASRDNLSTANYAVYTSATQNGTYTLVADNQPYAPHYDLMGAVGYLHDTNGVENPMDDPVTINADTVGLLYDTSGQKEFSLFQPLTTHTVGGETARIFEDTKIAIWDSLPITVGYDATAHIQLLTNFYQDTTIRAQNDVVYVKVVPKDSQGASLALSSVTPIAVTITGRANKPYPPRMFSYLGTNVSPVANISLDQMFQYPSHDFIRFYHYIYMGNADRLTESTPSSYWSPNATIEASTTNYVERLNADGGIAATYTSTINAIQSITTNWGLATEQYRIYSQRAGIRSVEQIVTINSLLRDIGTVTSTTIAQVGNDIQITVNVNNQGTSRPFYTFYELTGTLITDNAFGALSASNGVIVESDYALQIPQGITAFVLTIPTVAAVGKTLQARIGNMESTSFYTTNITVS